MKNAGIIATVAVCVGSLGCIRQEPSGKLLISESPTRPRVTVEKPVDVLDAEVVAVVLDDLLTFAGDDSPVAVRGSPPNKILFAAKPARYPETVDQVLYQHKKKLWLTLTAGQTTAAREAAENLVKRLQNRDDSAEFKTKDKRIRIHVEREPQSQEESDRSMFERPIQAWPPGYSTDRRFAIVRLVIPWSIHHAEGTYLLSEENGKWTVLLRQFVYYV